MSAQKSLDLLVEKWEPVLESEKAATISDSYRKKVTAQLLENQESFFIHRKNTD